MPAKAKTPSAPDPSSAGLIEVGKTAPAITLPDQDGRIHRLADYRGRWVVLYFYPKDDTSGCTAQACQFRDALLTFTDADAVILGVSPDGQASHAKFVAKHKLPFTLLADPDKTTLTAYGVWQQKSMYGRKYMGVVRTTYLIDAKGKVAARWDKVKVPGHEAQVLERIAELKAG